MDELNDNLNNLTTKGVYDFKLVQLALSKGDQKAYAELLQRYRESVYYMMPTKSKLFVFKYGARSAPLNNKGCPGKSVIAGGL